MKNSVPAAILALAATIVLIATSAVGGEGMPTILVTSGGDRADFGGDRQIEDLPGPDGVVTLREAIYAADNTIGPEFIHFAIPTSDPVFTGEFFEIQVEGPLVLRDDGTVLDMTTQTAATGDTNPNGGEIAIRTTPPYANTNTFSVYGSNHVFRGLWRCSLFRNAIWIAGDGNRVEACQLSGGFTAAVHIDGGNDNVIGGTEPGQGNTIFGGDQAIRIVGDGKGRGTGNVIVGNILTGGVNGIRLFPGADRTRIGGPTAAERNILSGSGYTGEHGIPVGEQLEINSNDNVIQGNWIGLDTSGTQRVPAAARVGVLITGHRNRFGGSGPGEGNVVSGIGGNTERRNAIQFEQDASENVVQGNLIGTDASGEIPLANRWGIHFAQYPGFDGPVDNVVGGRQPGEGNLVANSEQHGVVLLDGVRNTVTGNSIRDNGGLGIDIGLDGVTPNDTGDGDSGTNDRQNYPVLATALDNGLMTAVTGTIDTIDPTGVSIELFSSANPDASGFGEGEVFHVAVTPDSAGAFSATLPGGLIGQWVTATATNASGSTSEFSAALEVTSPTGVTLFVDVTPQNTVVAPGGTLVFDVLVTNSSAQPRDLFGWLDIVKPNGQPWHGNPLVPARAFRLEAGSSLARTVSLRVPAGTPPSGPYELFLRISPSASGPPASEDSFAFTVAE